MRPKNGKGNSWLNGLSNDAFTILEYVFIPAFPVSIGIWVAIDRNIYKGITWFIKKMKSGAFNDVFIPIHQWDISVVLFWVLLIVWIVITLIM